jgi:tetratricopeptide (TPR) repeat protein
MGHLEDAEAWSAKALEGDAESVKAREVLAALHALDDSFEKSLAEIQSMLGVNSNDLRALSLLAACSEAMGRTDERDEALERIRKINDSHAGAYLELARTSERRRQVPAAVDWAEKAIEANPENWEGYYLAGTALLHAGEETRGYALLQEAFTRNAFNVWAYNLLHVLDRDLQRNEFIYHSTPHFFVKLDRTESDILWPYLETMLEEMYERQTRKYEFEPKGPEQYDGKILVSTFPSHDEFSARTVGLPGMGAAGACLGSVITMVSPRAMQRSSIPFNWRSVLEHELLHVITLQKTGYRIPRWFTEGLSTYEERNAQRQMDPILVWALAEDKLLPLERLNVGFYRPSFQYQIPLSYYHASLICAYIEEKLGFSSILAMLDGYAANRSTEEILLSVSGKELDVLNGEIQRFVGSHAEQIKIPPRLSDRRMQALEEASHTGKLDADEWVDLASRYMLDCKAEEARNAVKRAIEADSDHTRANALQAQIAYTLDKDTARAEMLLNKVKKADADFFSARLHLGIIARENGKTQEAIREFEAARKLYPRFHAPENSPYTALVELYEETKRPEKAIEVLRELIAVDRGLPAAHRCSPQTGRTASCPGQARRRRVGLHGGNIHQPLSLGTTRPVRRCLYQEKQRKSSHAGTKYCAGSCKCRREIAG